MGPGTLVNDSFPVLAIQFCTLNDVMFGVCPVQLISPIVQGQTIRPVEVLVSDDGTVLSIHVAALYLWSASPVTPKYCSTTVAKTS